ncbi:MAG: 16S rRNA (guanine(527)-N(7))-methyltransferase RsmG [Rhodanobacteraceae bacterium]
MFQRESLRPLLTGGLIELDLDVPQSGIERLFDYLELLVHWNVAYNLTAVRDPVAMVTRHLLDSLAIARFVAGKTLVDLGSGAGLPGIPLAIADPLRRVTLVDSNGKKARFLREVARRLDLGNATVAECRVETLEGRFDCVTTRAFAALADMLDIGGNLLAPGGVWLAQKGRVPQDELDAVRAPFGVAAVHRLSVPGLDAERHVVIIKRTGSVDHCRAGNQTLS